MISKLSWASFFGRRLPRDRVDDVNLLPGSRVAGGQDVQAQLTFILDRFRPRMRFFPLSQQAVAIGGLLLNDRVVGLVIHLVLGEVQLPWTYWVAPLLGMLLWAPLYLVLDALRLNRRR